MSVSVSNREPRGMSPLSLFFDGMAPVNVLCGSVAVLERLQLWQVITAVSVSVSASVE